jgi:DnaJ-domain-containing protein 1
MNRRAASRRRPDRRHRRLPLRRADGVRAHAKPKRRSRARIIRATVVLRTLRHPFSRAAIFSTVARDDANANRLRVIRAILVASGSSTTRFREVVQKNFLRRLVGESDAIPSSRGARSCVARGITPTASRACRACKKSAIHKGFLHRRKIGDELARGAK